MTPILSSSNLVNKISGHSEFGCDLRSCSGGRKNGQGGSFAINRHSVLISGNCTTFGSSIHIIVSWGSKEKVVRIGALWVIALMQNVHSIWNLAARYLKGKCMRAPYFVQVAKVPIAIGTMSALPFPASISRLNHLEFINTDRATKSDGNAVVLKFTTALKAIHNHAVSFLLRGKM